jgi:hypothetical protein
LALTGIAGIDGFSILDIKVRVRPSKPTPVIPRPVGSSLLAGFVGLGVLCIRDKNRTQERKARC